MPVYPQQGFIQKHTTRDFCVFISTSSLKEFKQEVGITMHKNIIMSEYEWNTSRKTYLLYYDRHSKANKLLHANSV